MDARQLAKIKCYLCYNKTAEKIIPLFMLLNNPEQFEYCSISYFFFINWSWTMVKIKMWTTTNRIEIMCVYTEQQQQNTTSKN